MKFTKTTLLTIPLFVVLVFSLSFNVTTSIAQGAPFPSQTGDMFTFDIYGNNTGNSERAFNLWNYTDPVDVQREENHTNWEITTYDGSMDVTFARNANVSGDTWAYVERETNTINPSQSGGSEFVFQKGDPSQDRNEVFPVLDHLGENRRDEESSPVQSNSTYSVIFEEIDRQEIRVDFFQPLGDGTVAMPPQVAPMTSLTVYTTSMNWPINADDNSRTVRVVSATFSLTWQDNSSSTSFPLGNTDPVTFSMNQTLSYSSTLEYYYDNSNGILLGSNTSASLSYEAFMWASNFQLSFGGVASPGFLSANQTISIDWESDDSFSVHNASYGYGETRPTSSGTNRLEKGDVLIYRVESEGIYDSFVSVDFSDVTNTATWGREENGKFEARGDGTAEIRVWKHQAGFIDNLLVMRTETTGTESRDVTETINGVIQPYRPEENFNRPISDSQFQLDFFGSPSNDSYEIAAEVDQEMYFDLGNNDKDCRDCGDGGLNFPVQSFMPRDDMYRELFVPEPDVAGEPIIVINGNNFYVLNVEGLYGEFSNFTSGTFRLRMGDGPGSQEVDAYFTMNSTGEQSYFWDEDTGVLLRIEENTFIDITFSFTGQVPSDDNPEVMVNLSLAGNIQVQNKFALTLEEHPNEYFVGQEPPVSSTSTDTSSTLTTTVDTISSSSTSTDESDNGADLPLPVPIVPVFIGFAILAIYTRKRKF